VVIKFFSRLRDFLHFIGDRVPDRDIRSLAGNARTASPSETVSDARAAAQTMESASGMKRGAEIIFLVALNLSDRQSGVPGAIARPGNASLRCNRLMYF
jgi:hypothetical protein